MEQILSFKTRIYPTQFQQVILRKAFGTRRWCYNWLLDQVLVKKEKGSAYTFDVILNGLIKDNSDEYGWIKESNTMVKSYALQDACLAIKKYFKEISKLRDVENDKEPININKFKPRYKSRKGSHQSFRIQNKNYNTFVIKGKHLLDINRNRKLGRQSFYSKEKLGFLKKTKIKTVTFGYEHGVYYIGITYERINHELTHGNKTIGGDLGIKNLLTIYDGTNSNVIQPPNFQKERERLKRLDRAIARSRDAYEIKLDKLPKGTKLDYSHNYNKLVLRRAKLYAHIANAKKDHYNKVCVRLCKEASVIKIDDFSFKHYLEMNQVEGVVGRHDRTRKLYEVSPYLFKTILEWQAIKHGVQVLYVPKGTPTTQTCSQCGVKSVTKVKLKDRTFTCPNCGAVLDRDVNSAINVYNLLIN